MKGDWMYYSLYIVLQRRWEKKEYMCSKRFVRDVARSKPVELVDIVFGTVS